MKYIILCGGMNSKEQTRFDKPRHLLEIKGEPIIARTIRLLRENGVEDIAISTDAPELFKGFGVEVFKCSYGPLWLECFPLTYESTCFIFGDVVFSPEAIKKIVETETEDVEFFASAPPFPTTYKKRWAEPFAFKVKDMQHFFEAIGDTLILRARYNAFKREPIAWELWQVIKGTPLNIIDYTNYTVINDYTCDIDKPEDIKNFQFI
jgi:hypothetical protein